MIADLFDLLSAALAFATETFISILNACGMPFVAFITMLCGFLALNIVLGTLRMRAFGFMDDQPEEFLGVSRSEQFDMDVNTSMYRQAVSYEAHSRLENIKPKPKSYPKRLSSKYKK